MPPDDSEHVISVVQEFRSLSGWALLGSHEVLWSRYCLGLQSSEGLTGAGGSTLEVVYSCGWQVGAGCWQEALVLLHLGLFIGLLE